jgi:hypothetical protein
VERAHRGEIRDAERAELRRQLEASDCARTTELTLISNANNGQDLDTKEGTTLGLLSLRAPERYTEKVGAAEFSEVSIR